MISESNVKSSEYAFEYVLSETLMSISLSKSLKEDSREKGAVLGYKKPRGQLSILKTPQSKGFTTTEKFCLLLRRLPFVGVVVLCLESKGSLSKVQGAIIHKDGVNKLIFKQR